MDMGHFNTEIDTAHARYHEIGMLGEILPVF